jgi:cell fate regulator YaaT (PSP1 superfamily)
MERYEEAKAKEQDTMIRSRQISKDLGLEMKIGDVEYQGDGQKAIFYYIADGRVDFRQLIKVLADTFHIRIEMKQIGARQEAGRIGGIGPCGRELCCAKWLTKFQSVGTTAARFQDLSLNPQKMAGQCAKLKCCMNFEVDCYMEAQKDFPSKDVVLQTRDSDYYVFKQDTLARTITYSTSKDGPYNTVTISTRRAFDIIEMNKRGQKPEKLSLDGNKEEIPQFTDGVGDEELTRFDRSKRKKKSKNHHKGHNNNDRKNDNEEKSHTDSPVNAAPDGVQQ